MLNAIFKDKNIAASFLLLGGGVAGHVILEVARDSLFLEAFSSSALPWAYICVAMLSALLVVFLARRNGGTNTRFTISGGFFFTAVTVLGFIGLLQIDIPRHWVAFALYVWVGVYIILLVSSVWLLISSLFTIGQAKNAYGIISAGAAAGAILGSTAVSAITLKTDSIEVILFSAAIVFFIAGLTPLLFTLRPVSSTNTQASQQPDTSFFGELKKSDYVQCIAALVLFSTIAVTGVDWLFKVVVESEVASQDLSAFFARFYLIANIASVLIQVIFLQWFFRLFGATGTLYVFPVVLLVGVLLIFSPFVFAAILSLKFADSALKNSLHKPATELLYVPLHDHVRKKLKLALDLISLRGGQALGSTLILIGTFWFSAKAVAIVVILFGLIAAIYVSFRLKPKYVALFREYLREGRIGIDIKRPELDVVSVEMLIDSLSSNNNDVVLSALAFLKDEDKSALISPLILFHPSEKVVLSALDIFIQSPRPRLKNIALRLLNEDRESVRIAALRLLIQLDPPQPFLQAIIEGDDIPLKTTAMVTLAMRGNIDLSEIKTLAIDLQNNNDTAALANLCDSLALWSEPDLLPVYLQIYDATDDLALQKSVISAMRNIGDSACLDVADKAYNQPELTSYAEALFLRCGEQGFDRLQTMLHSNECSYRARIAIPGTMSKFDFPNISERLIDQFSDELDGAILFKVLRGLGRTGIVASSDSNKNRQLQQLDKLTERELERLTRYTSALSVMSDQVVSINNNILYVFFELISDRIQESLERVFRILNLRYEDNQFEQIFLDFQSDGERERANAEELLLHTVPRSQGSVVIDAINLLRDLPDLSLNTLAPAPAFPKLEGGEQNTFLKSLMLENSGIFKALLRDESMTVSSVTAYLVGCANLKELAEEVRAQLSRRPGDTLECFYAALEMLGLDDEQVKPSVVTL